ncbi:hypothetical protein DBZ36_07095 [Alginatibacterium sediminis]|uniref:Cell division protein ZapC n=1 Tax=Alginatibacterium sediminis TaxID=2164068 RepID=A0A420EHI3_9ALTE|nr:cell division protein ZapC domain-containing protein [Alginatibacterium sediminis]RKF20201.1 hypothetical protein DBZ36_07095 [Alginatibacterium sediminis]
MSNFSPDSTWRWSFCDKQQSLVLNIGDSFQFVSVINDKNCANPQDCEQSFLPEHLAYYSSLLDQMDNLDWPFETKLHIVLQALANGFFHKPIMPQSWHFQIAASSIRWNQNTDFQCGDIVVLRNLDDQVGRFLVIETSYQTACCMLIDPVLKLDDRKQLQQFQMIKVMTDRLQDLSQVMGSQNGYSKVG